MAVYAGALDALQVGLGELERGDTVELDEAAGAEGRA